MNELRYDVVVIGCGIAGASITWFLSKSGLKVCVLDWRDINSIGDKPCADAIGKHHLEVVGLPLPRGDEIEGTIRGALIYSPSEQYWIEVPGEGYEINTHKYVRRLIEESIGRGAEFFEKTKAIEPIISNDYVCGVVALRGSQRIRIRANVVVDASGISRVIVRKLPSSWPVTERIDEADVNVAYREERVVSEIERPEWIRVYVNQKIAPGGYWWLFPKNKIGVVNVGLGVQMSRKGLNPKKLFYKYLAERKEIQGRVIKAGGAPVPTRRPLSTLVWNGIAVIGDAAYTANPVHGGGKGPAMRSAKCVAEAIVRAHELGDYSARTLWQANLCYMMSYGIKQASLDVFRIFLQNLTNDDLEFVLKKGIVKGDDILKASLHGKLELGFVEKVVRAATALARPSILRKLYQVRSTMNRVSELYQAYPKGVDNFIVWYQEVENLFSELKFKLGL